MKKNLYIFNMIAVCLISSNIYSSSSASSSTTASQSDADQKKKAADKKTNPYPHLKDNLKMHTKTGIMCSEDLSAEESVNKGLPKILSFVEEHLHEFPHTSAHDDFALLDDFFNPAAPLTPRRKSKLHILGITAVQLFKKQKQQIVQLSNNALEEDYEHWAKMEKEIFEEASHYSPLIVIGLHMANNLGKKK